MGSNLEKMDDYFQGNLSPDDKQAFEEQLQQDETLAEEVALYKDMMGGVRLHNNAQLKTHLNEIHDRVIDKKMARRFRLGLKPALAIAASVLLLAVAYFFLDSKTLSHDQLYAQYYTVYEVDWTQRGTGAEDNTELIRQLYTQGDFERLFQLIESGNIQHQIGESRFKLIAGITYLETNHFEAAQQRFSELERNPILGRTALWYQALAHLKAKEIDACKAILQTLATESNADWQAEASQLLEAL